MSNVSYPCKHGGQVFCGSCETATRGAVQRARIIEAIAADIQRQCTPGGYCSGDLYFDVGVCNMTIDSSIDLGELADAVIDVVSH